MGLTFVKYVEPAIMSDIEPSIVPGMELLFQTSIQQLNHILSHIVSQTLKQTLSQALTYYGILYVRYRASCLTLGRVVVTDNMIRMHVTGNLK